MLKIPQESPLIQMMFFKSSSLYLFKNADIRHILEQTIFYHIWEYNYCGFVLSFLETQAIHMYCFIKDCISENVAKGCDFISGL